MTSVQYLPITEVSKVQSFVRYATRVVTDGATSTNTALTSATATFTAADVGAAVSGAGIQANTTIASVTNGTTVVLSLATTATASSVTVTITQTAALGVPVFATALNSAFGAAAGNIQCVVDNTSGLTTQAVVVSGDTTVFSVPLGGFVSYFQNTWQQLTPTQLAASYTPYYVS